MKKYTGFLILTLVLILTTLIPTNQVNASYLVPPPDVCKAANGAFCICDVGYECVATLEYCMCFESYN